MRTAILLLTALLLVAAGLWFSRSRTEPPTSLVPHVIESDRSPSDAGDPLERGGRQVGSMGARASDTSPSEDPQERAAERVPTPAPNELRGRVVDAEGHAVEGCSIALHPGQVAHFAALGRALPNDAPSSTTAADGSFHFTGVEPGEEHALVARHPDYALALVPGVVVPERGVHHEPPIVLARGKRLRGLVSDEQGAPIAGATLVLEAGWTPAREAPGFDRRSARTCADGNYEIHGIADGRRSLTVSAEGYGTRTLVDAILFEDRLGSVYQRDFRLARALTIAGRVRAEDGSPIAGARLSAIDLQNPRLAAHGEAHSDAHGAFGIGGLQPGRYLVQANAEGFGRVRAADQSPPVTELELTLPRTPSLHGRVVAAADGRPVTSFALRLRSEALPGMATTPHGPLRVFEDAPGGAFVLPDLLPGTWQLEVVAPGYAPAYTQDIDCSGEDVTGLVVALERGATLRGLVLDSKGAPIAGARILCRDDEHVDDALIAMLGDELPTLASTASARSADDGDFLLQDLYPHRYQLIANAPGRAPVRLRGLELTAGEERELAPIVLAPGATLRGLLLDAEREPVPGGRLFLRPLDPSSSHARSQRKSASDGSFVFPGLAAGRYMLSGAPPLAVGEPARTPQPRSSGAGREREIELFPGVEALLELELEGWRNPAPPPEPPPSGNLAGKLTDASGAALVGQGIELVPSAAGQPALASKSERGGEFHFLRVPPGDYVLRASGHDEPAHAVTIRVDRWTHQDLRLP